MRVLIMVYGYLIRLSNLSYAVYIPHRTVMILFPFILKQSALLGYVLLEGGALSILVATK